MKAHLNFLLAPVTFVLMCSASLGGAFGAEVLQTQPNDEVKRALVDLETKSWVAWKARDATYFVNFLSQDHVEVGFAGPIGKDAVVRGVGSPACTVESYSLGDMQFTRIAEDTAVLVYRAEQKTLCGGNAVPSPVWATSLFVKRSGHWLNVLYQHTLAAPLP